MTANEPSTARAPGRTTRWRVLATAPPGVCDGVGDHAYRLALALATHGQAELLICAPPRRGPVAGDRYAGPLIPTRIGSFAGLWRLPGDPRPDRRTAWVVEYVPQSFLRWDTGALLVTLAWRRLRGDPVILAAHEWNVAWKPTLRRAVARLAFDLMLLGLGGAATAIVAPQERYRREIARRLFWKASDRVAVIPVGANVPAVGLQAGADGRAPRRLAMFGRPAGLDERLLRAIGSWLAAAGPGVALRWIGRARAEVLHLWRERCGLSPALLDIHEAVPAPTVARLLAECEVYLAPLADGVSTRSTTVAAALAQGLPVVGTDGPATSDELRRSGAFALAPSGDAARFVSILDAVLEDPARRAAMSAAALTLSERRFSWTGIAAAYERLVRSIG